MTNGLLLTARKIHGFILKIEKVEGLSTIAVHQRQGGGGVRNIQITSSYNGMYSPLHMLTVYIGVKGK